MDRHKRLLIVLITFFLMTKSVTGLASEANIMRSLPTDDPRATSVQYIYPVSPEQVYPVILSSLKKNFPIKFEEKENKSDIEKYGKYGDIRSDYKYCDEHEKKCRKRCYALIHLIPGYPDYSLVTVGCYWEYWQSRFGVHNLFDWKWDWMPEGAQSLFLSEDILESIRVGLGLTNDKVVRLRQYYSAHNVSPLIKQYEEK